MNAYFGLLFARPSFLEGVSRVIDLGNTMSEYNSSLTPAQADALALKADLNALRSDLAYARQALGKSDKFSEDDNEQQRAKH